MQILFPSQEKNAKNRKKTFKKAQKFYQNNSWDVGIYTQT